MIGRRAGMLNEPLLHFLVIGALLFGGYRLFGEPDAAPFGAAPEITGSS